MPGSALATYVLRSTTVLAAPRYRTANQATGSASTTVSAAAAAPSASEVPAAEASSWTGNSVEEPTISQCTRLYVGSPAASATSAATSTITGQRRTPSRCR